MKFIFFVASNLINTQLFLFLHQVHICYGSEDYRVTDGRRTGGRRDGQRDGQTEGQTDGWTLWIIEDLLILQMLQAVNLINPITICLN